MLLDVPRLDGARVTVMGLGLFGAGVGVTTFLCRAGARVTVTDLRSAEDLHESVAALAGWPVDLHLGEHREEDFRAADFVVVSPAVPSDSPWLAMAPGVETELNLFVKLCPTRSVYGITGSNGKTTTTSLVGEILRRGPRPVWVGGNIGKSLLTVMDDIGPDDVVVLELSSFQLDNLDPLRWSPPVSVVLNVTPNHLDRHGSMPAYVEAKRAIVRHQREGDLRVLNADDPVVREFATGPADVRWFGWDDEGARAAAAGGDGFRNGGAGGAGARDGGRTADGARAGGSVSIRGESIVVGGQPIDLSSRRLPGSFNLVNMAAATAATASAFPGWAEAAGEVLRTFAGVEHRLEYVAEIDGVTYYDDSIATTPERTLAALDTLTGPLLILLGGYDKGLSFERLGRVVRKRCRAAIVFGDTASAIADAIIGDGPEMAGGEESAPGGPAGAQDACEIHRAASLAEAVAIARANGRPGEAVLLSPACASYGMFRNFTDRGRRFKELVRG